MKFDPSMTANKWIKSSFSAENVCCVEIMKGPMIAMRDSKTPRLAVDDTILNFSAEAWRSFIAGVKAGEFDLDEEESSGE